MSLIDIILSITSSHTSGGGGGGTLETPVLFATSPSSTEIDLSCNAVGGADTYIFEQSPDGETSWAVIQSGSTRTKNVTGLTAGTTYYFRVKAHGTGYSDSVYYSVSVKPRESWAGTQVTFEGDSITAGVGASDHGSGDTHRWTTILSGLRGNTERNRGFNSETMQDNGCAYPEFAGTFAKATGDKYLFVALGVNDQGINTSTMTPAAFQSTYQSWINTFLTQGWAAGDIVLVTPYYVTGYSTWVGGCGVTVASNVTRHEQYVQKVRDLAIANHCILADIYVAMRDSATPSSLLSGDGVHPNDTGHAFIANFMDNLNYTPQ